MSLGMKARRKANLEDRIGNPGPTSGGRQKDMIPFTVQDEYGNILYR
jgi:hypothetical protein